MRQAKVQGPRSGRVLTVTVLGGSSGGIPTGSGILLDAGSGPRLVDCGNGIVGALADRAALDVADVVLTHLHADHVQDLYPLALYRRYRRRPLPVAGPPGTAALAARWFPLFTSSPEAMLAAVPVREVAPGERLQAAGMTLTPFAVEHDIPAYGYAAHAPGARVVISGDTRACPALEGAARGADVLVCESTFAGEGAEASRAHHMTAAQAGALARRAGVGRLVLTHLLLTTDPETARREAEAAFGSAVELARRGATWRVG